MRKKKLPGTFEVSTVCTVGGGAAGTTGSCTGAGWVGLGGCDELIPGLCIPELLTGTKTLGGGVGAMTWDNVCTGVGPT